MSLVFASIRISLLAAPGPGMEVNWFCSFLGLHDGGIVGGHVSERFFSPSVQPPLFFKRAPALFQNMLRRHEEFENGTAWSNSSESSDDSSSPRLSAVGLRGSARHKVRHAGMGWWICRPVRVSLSRGPLACMRDQQWKGLHLNPASIARGDSCSGP